MLDIPLDNGLTPERQAREEAEWNRPWPRKIHQSHFTMPEMPWKRAKAPIEDERAEERPETAR